MKNRRIGWAAGVLFVVMTAAACGISSEPWTTSQSFFEQAVQRAEEIKEAVSRKIAGMIKGGEDFAEAGGIQGSEAGERAEEEIHELVRLGEETMTVIEGEIRMETEEQGEADVVIQLPNYEELFSAALQSENPDEYLENALKNGDYETKEIEAAAVVTVEEGKQVVHGEEAAKEVLEHELVSAFISLTKEENKE